MYVNHYWFIDLNLLHDVIQPHLTKKKSKHFQSSLPHSRNLSIMNTRRPKLFNSRTPHRDIRCFTNMRFYKPVVVYIHVISAVMRGSRKFYQRGSNFDNVFFSLMRGGRIQIPLLAGHQHPASETPFKWRFACGLMMAQH